MNKSCSSRFGNWLCSRNCLVFLGFLAIAAFFLWEEHKAHILGYLPYFLLLLCPLLHLFLHGGRGGGHRGNCRPREGGDK